MKIYIILGIFILTFFLIIYIYPYREYTTNENYANKSKKNVLIFSAGPSLNELKNLKKYLTKEFLDNTYVICVKSAINEVYNQGIKVDCLVTNFVGSFKDIKEDIINASSPHIACVEFDDKTSVGTYLENKCDYKLNLLTKNNKKVNCMECIIDDELNCLEFKSKNNKLYTKWGHIMMEAAIPVAVKMKPENIYILGWDIDKTNKNHYNEVKKEQFTNKNNSKNIRNWRNFEDVNYFTKYLPGYLKKHYNINIYKLSNTQKIQIPYANLKLLFGKKA